MSRKIQLYEQKFSLSKVLFVNSDVNAKKSCLMTVHQICEITSISRAALYRVLVQKSFDRDIETYMDCSMTDYDAIPNNLCMNLTSFWADFTCG
ncbi:hypothetical protein AZF08_09635 [Bacillus gaemokensis]|nr:hypothetical protein AZF08_09635 [Bacillus gaemokensis]